MTRLLLRLGRWRWLHMAVAAFHVYPIADRLLERFPLQRITRSGGLSYRITSMDQLSIESGIFQLDEYEPALRGREVRTFIDLGCNAGWFAIWVASRDQNLERRGLLIDAHPRMAREAAWHMRRNRLAHCVVVHGAVGLAPGQSSVRFYAQQSTSASSVLPYQHAKQLPAKGKVNEVTVPALSVGTEWHRYFGGEDVDLLKIDIEGKELDFLIYESAFVRVRVKAVVVEWHEWHVSFARLDEQFRSLGYALSGTSDFRDMLGLAVYENASRSG